MKLKLNYKGSPYNFDWYIAYMDLANKVQTLFDNIKHGDKSHQEWLRKKIEEHFNA